MPSYLFDRLSQFVSTIFPLASVDWNDHLSEDDPEEAHLRTHTSVPTPHPIHFALSPYRVRSRRWDRCSASADLNTDASSPPDLARAKLRLRLLREQRTELRNAVDTLTHRLATRERQLAELRRHTVALPPDSARAHEELEAMPSTVATLERQNAHLLYRNDYHMAVTYEASKQLAAQQNSFTDRITVFKLELDHMYHERDRLAERVEHLEQRLLDSDVQRCMLSIVSAERDQLEERLQKAHAGDVFTVAAENKHLKMQTELSDTKRRLESVTKKLLEAWHHKKQLSIEVESRLHNEASMLQMFGDLKRECQRLRDERDLAAQNAAQVQQTVEDMNEEAKQYQSVCQQRDQLLQRADHLQSAYTELANILGCSSVPTEQMDTKQLSSIVNNTRFRVHQSEIERQSSAELAAMRETELDRLQKQLRKERDARANLERRIECISAKHAQLAAAIGHRECPLDVETGLADIYPHVRRLGEVTKSQQDTILTMGEKLASNEAEAKTAAMEVEKLRQVRRRIKTEANDLENKVHSLEAEMSSLSRENSAMRHTLQSMEQEDKQHEGISQVLELEKERNAANIRGHGVELAQLRSQIAEKNAEIENSANEIDRVHKLVSDLEYACKELQGEKEVLVGQVSTKIEESDVLRADVGDAVTKLEQLRAECTDLQGELAEQRRIVSEEREELANQLAERTANFARVEAELHDARTTYIEAAENFEMQRAALTKRLNTSQREKQELKNVLTAMNSCSGDEGEKQLLRTVKRCEQLERENEGLRQSMIRADVRGRSLSSRGTKSDDDDSSFKSDCSSITSALTANSGGSDDAMWQRVQQLESLLENEARERENKSKRLNEAEYSLKEMCAEMERMKVLAREKEREAEGLRNEMTSIHSRMRKMAHVSMPRDYEKWLEDDDEDLKRLRQVREATRKERDVDRRSKGRRKSKGVALENKGR
ncbi:unnamed protein product [Agarophyton chilense]|eukprot:gb/GEZJ01001318.1/.p1 GENE.gb/GEZJ01001318.1/~~gb/GEZJ01001318.1/.p1  ORF type:complete len:947 (+),score=200.25 gb/GEZJ01001318.1/:104-2944(+)